MGDERPTAIVRDELEEFYDDFRTACLAKKYYSGKLTTTQRVSLSVDIATAIGASGSLAALKFLEDYAFFKTALPYFAATAAILSIAKPLLGFDRATERYTKLVSGYTEIVEAMKRIIREVKRTRDVSKDNRERMLALQANVDKLVCLDDPKPNRRQLTMLQHEIEEEFPLDFFYWPPKHGTAAMSPPEFGG
jgi:hypothetical protein